MRKRGLRVLGILYLLVGISFLIGSSSITGFVIFENTGIAYGFSFYFGVLFLMIGGLILMGMQRGLEIPGGLEDLITKSKTLAVPELEILPDTIFLGEIAESVKKGAFDMTGYNIVLLNQVLTECQRKHVDKRVLNYLISQRYAKAKLQHDPKVGKYEPLIRDAWQNYCKENNAQNRLGEIDGILVGADSRLLVYGIERGKKPTLILSEDTHLKKLAPYVNKKAGSNISVYGLVDYTHSTREANARN